MHVRDYRDLIGGALLVALGLFIALWASAFYEIGTPARMGPGMFPAALGYLLAGLGVLVVLPALARTGRPLNFRWRSFVTCLAAVLLFALTLERLGMVPAIVLLVVASVLADHELGIVGTALLAAALAVLGALIFSFGLGMTVPLFAWRF